MPDDFPYRSHGQPITAYASLLGCIFILVVANGASLWKKPSEVDFWKPFLAAYLTVSVRIVETQD
jgi:amino acid transporter